ncbi:hypothetical protein ABZS66_22895 [Dactylosporangium sp. NPDC005572]|uniref:TOTE conflict system archaeo-eukaryotic primase domain-containing protein n=1 Tax=Dactylosporangium sp. NPDC005572 TaxID=3156889 RepID=UPI0033A136D3
MTSVARGRLAVQRLVLFRSLLVGRDDVYAQRCEKDGQAAVGARSLSDCLADVARNEGRRRYRPLADDVLHDHLSGRTTVGLYPMLGAVMEAADSLGVIADWRTEGSRGSR